MKSKTVGFIVLTIIILSLATKLLLSIMNYGSPGTVPYICNYVGDFVVLIGIFLFFKNSLKGIPFINVGSTFILSAGLISITTIEGIIFVISSLAFIILTKRAHFV